jgi:hypothetical protein
MRRLAYMAALVLVATLVLAPSAIAQQMSGEHMMPDGQMMDDSQMMGANNMMASPSASASASTSASASPSASATPTATATASAPGAITIMEEEAVAPLQQLLAAGSRVPAACPWWPWCLSELWPYSWGSGSLRPGCCAEALSLYERGVPHANTSVCGPESLRR